MDLIPSGLQAYAGRGPDWSAWLDTLPAVVRALTEEWQLTRDGDAMHGHTALVLPVRTDDGTSAMLKVGFPHPEAEHEHLALQRWHGTGAVRLLRADPRRFALLLERLDSQDLGDHWDVQACEIVGDLYARLHVAAPPQLRPLHDYVAELAVPLGTLPRDAPIPRRLVEQARSLVRDLTADPAGPGESRLLHTDLHYANVLADRHGEWRAIDPKPLAGDPHYEVAPMLWNRFEELSGRVRDGVRDRFHALIDAAGLEEEQARDWVVVRVVLLALERLQDPPGRVRLMSTGDLLTMCVAIAKAVQD